MKCSLLCWHPCIGNLFQQFLLISAKASFVDLQHKKSFVALLNNGSTTPSSTVANNDEEAQSRCILASSCSRLLGPCAYFVATTIPGTFTTTTTTSPYHLAPTQFAIHNEYCLSKTSIGILSPHWRSFVVATACSSCSGCGR